MTTRRRDIQRRFLERNGWFYNHELYRIVWYPCEGWCDSRSTSWNIFSREIAFNKQLRRHSKNIQRKILNQLKGAV